MWREDTVQHRTEKYLLKATEASFLDGWRKGEHWHNKSRVLVHMEEPEKAADSN